MMKFKIKTAPPKGRGSWAPDLASKVQENIFSIVAMLVAANPELEEKRREDIYGKITYHSRETICCT